ncbi:MAG: exo-alpha-sialidase [Bacteroidetes bacterium]|nr:exo-alpha-sialidase [Bacteroidota bacterium]
MKKKLLFTSIFFLGTLVSQAQWQPDVRLTNDPAPSNTSLNNAWCVASSGDTVIAVWDDQRDGNYEIYYKRSTDAGLSWGADTRLTNNTSYSYDPCIAISGLNIHVVWQNEQNGFYQIYYKHSTDGGLNWSADTSLTNVSADLWNPSITLNGTAVHVVWEDERQGNSEIYYKGSTDGGLSWGADTRLTTDIADSWNPSVSVSGSVVHVVWYDNRDGNWEIYYKRSADGGVNWGADVRMTTNPSVSRYPCVTVSGSVVQVVWHDDRDGNYEIYYKRSTDGGLTWGLDTRLTNSAGGSFFPSVAVSGSFVHVVWFDMRDGIYEIYYKRSVDDGISWGTDTRLTNDSAYSFYPSVAVSGPVVHVVWQDMRDGNYEIYYKRDTTANTIGINESPACENTIQIFPNPFLNRMTVNNSKNELCEITIYDITSRILVHQKFTNTITLNTSQLANGIYIYEVRNKNTVLRKGKIAKD